MKTQRAEELRQEWGGKPCRHPKFEEEFFQGMHTGAFVCTICGAAQATRAQEQLQTVG